MAPEVESSGSRTDALLPRAAAGDQECLGKLLESYRKYLALLAASQLDEGLRAKVSPSDLVQETMLHAFRDFRQFQGHHEHQLLAWLRQILINRLHIFVQQFVLAQKRSTRREVSLEQIGASLARSTANIQAGWLLAGRERSPSSNVMRRENAVELANHLAAMPADYRDVIVYRNLQGHPFDEVAARMERSSGAVRMLWLRAIKELQDRMPHGEFPSTDGPKGEAS